MVLIYYKKRPFCIYTFDNWREELLHRHQKAIWTSVPSGLSENFFTLPLSLKSSTMTISCRNCLGDISITLCTVLIRVDQPSLWKTNMTLAEGRSSGYCQYLHLLVNQSEVKGHRKKQGQSLTLYTLKNLARDWNDRKLECNLTHQVWCLGWFCSWWFCHY